MSESIDYRIILGSSETSKLVGSVTLHHFLAVIPTLSGAQREEILYLQRDEEIFALMSSDLYEPTPHTEMTFSDMLDGELIDLAANVAGYLRLRSYSTADVDPEIVEFNIDEESLVSAYYKLQEK
ncbi:MAG TPA: hypothetical protein VLF63_01195 [Patescibacteria group bacterium]|nr:hypothetical protein [Patescibacteria group bacterium]